MNHHRSILRDGGRLLVVALLAAAALTAGAASAAAVDVAYATNWTAGLNPGYELGTSVASYGDLHVIGAPGAFTEQGRVYVYQSDSSGALTLLQTLQDPSPHNGDRFGEAVAVDRDTIAVGAPYDDGAGGPTASRGAVHVFTQLGSGVWAHATTLYDPNQTDGWWLGQSVAVSGNSIVAGSPNAGAGHTGCALVFRRSVITGAWAFSQRLTPPGAASGDQVGRSVAVYMSTIVVGAPDDDAAGTGRGAVHVYLPDATGMHAHEQELTNPAAGDNDRFGWSVDVDAGTIVAGTPYAGPASGSVQVFTRDSATGDWLLRQHLTDPAAQIGDRLGTSVAVHRNAIVAGAPGDDGGGVDRGAVHTFYKLGSTWTHRQELSGMGGPRLGSAVEVRDHGVVAGSPDYNFAGREYAGRADFFLPRALCGGQPATLVGTSGPDVLTGGTGDDTIVGLDGGDTIFGGEGRDRICGGTGNDIISGNGGRDTLVWGGGIDWVSYLTADTAVSVSLARGTASGGDGRDKLTGVENIAGSRYDDRLRGDDGPNQITGGSGDDTLLGGPGDDALSGGPGFDSADGGPGADVCDAEVLSRC